MSPYGLMMFTVEALGSTSPSLIDQSGSTSPDGFQDDLNKRDRKDKSMIPITNLNHNIDNIDIDFSSHSKKIDTVIQELVSGSDDDVGFKLLPVGRLRHSEQYIRSLAASVGLRVLSAEVEVLRKQSGNDVKSITFVLGKHLS